MKIMLLLLLPMTTLCIGYHQNDFQATILDEETKEPLVAVHILFETLERGSITDVDGIVNIKNLPNGEITGKIFYIGYEETSFTVTLPQEYLLTIYLKPTSKK